MSTMGEPGSGDGAAAEYHVIEGLSDRDLDDKVFDGTPDDRLNAFIGLYNMLPEHEMAGLVGSDIVVRTEGAPPMYLSTVAMYGASAVALDRSSQHSKRDRPRYMLLRGSVYTDFEEALDQPGSQSAVAGVVSAGKGGVSTVEGFGHMAYANRSFLRDGRLAYTRLYAPEDLREAGVKSRTTRVPMNGCVITVMLKPDTPTPLFVEEPFRLSSPIQGLAQKVGGDFLPLLSYTDQDPHTQ